MKNEKHAEPSQYVLRLDDMSGRCLWRVTFGYDWVVIGGAKPFYEAYFGITDPAQSGWAMSSALAGCVLVP